MLEEQTETQKPEPVKDPILINYIKDVEEAEKDSSLTELQQTISVILNVKGLIVTGKIISFDKYLDLLEKQEPSNDTDENEELVGRISDTSEETNKVEEQKDRYYIHLKDAKFYVSPDNSLPINDGLLWRGRLSSIDGFVLGVAFRPRTDGDKVTRITINANK